MNIIVLMVMSWWVLPITTAESYQNSEIKVAAEFGNYRIVDILPEKSIEQKLQAALLAANPNTIVQLPEGRFEFTRELSVSVDNIVLRGANKNSGKTTILQFSGQLDGGQAVLATGNNFVLQDIVIEDPPGDGVKVSGSNGVRIERVRVEWTNGAHEDNGAYGIYPIRSKNILIADSEVRGASDAGIYVGQSKRVIIQRNRLHENVAGIEIENSELVDVLQNRLFKNTGGILVFNLPGLPVLGTSNIRIFKNFVARNNTPNFARQGNIVGMVPAGTGLMVLASDNVDIFSNEFSHNQSAAIVIASYYLKDPRIRRPAYDPIPERINIFDNRLTDNGASPTGFAEIFYRRIPADKRGAFDILYDDSGVGRTEQLYVEHPNGLPDHRKVCMSEDMRGARIGRLNLSALLSRKPVYASTYFQPKHCILEKLEEVELAPPVSPRPKDYKSAAVNLCQDQAEGRNFRAYKSDCTNLSDYRLFRDPADPTRSSNDGIAYTVNTSLFSDYTDKHRFIFLPADGQMTYKENGPFDFPIGSIIAKTFSTLRIKGSPSSGRELIETRLLIRRDNGWVALPYIWNREQTDAKLVPGGGVKELSWQEDNEVITTAYTIPNTNQCSTCHGEHAVSPIGLRAAALNKAPQQNEVGQLAKWSQAGDLAKLPARVDNIPRMASEYDPAASTEEKARAYLDINCAHCHSPSGSAQSSGLFLEYNRKMSYEVGLCKLPIAAGSGAEDNNYVILPGMPDNSILLSRMLSTRPDIRMPELGRSLVHIQGSQLVEDWLRSMKYTECRAKH